VFNKLNNNAFFKGDPKQRSKWITQRELSRFIRLPVMAFGLKSYMVGFQKLGANILMLWKKSGSLFLTQYLAECARSVICWAGNETYSVPPKGVRISLSRAGLPVIIPTALRVRMYQMKRSSTEGWLITKVVLTVLSVYRVIGCPPILKIGTITGPFTGQVRSLPSEELRRALNNIRLPRLKSPDFTIVSESSGPNYPRATWSSCTDAYAMLFYPRNWLAYMRWCHAHGWSLAIVWMLWMNLITLILLPLLLYFGFRPRYIGRLAKLNEARGKVRVIAICDYWTQLVLRPLHDSLFRLLPKIEQDGTFNQVRPFKALVDIARLKGGMLNSFDLSAATDRIPIDIQVDILSLLGVDGNLWKDLLERPWFLVQKRDGVIIKEESFNYSVGQPMGAYSSWGMLALTHHVIVQVAARRVGYTDWFRDYALLGDDIVILGSDVSAAYLSIMRDLGVDINLFKSHQGYVGEFAKHWIHPHFGDLSPLGAGNILVAVRNYKLMPSIVLDAVQKGFPFPLAVINNLLVIAKSFNRKVNKRTLTAMSLLMLGPTGALGATNQLSVETLEAWLNVATKGVKRGFILQAIQNAVMQIKMQEDDSLQTQYHREQESFRKLWWRLPPYYWTLSFNYVYRLYNHIKEDKTFRVLKWTWGFNFLDELLPTSINLEIPHPSINWEVVCWIILLRISPGYFAYNERTEPDEAEWYTEEFLHQETGLDAEGLLTFGNLISQMMGIDPAQPVSLDWSKEKSIASFLETQSKFVKLVERRLQILSKPKGPVKTALVVYQPKSDQ